MKVWVVTRIKFDSESRVLDCGLGEVLHGEIKPTEVLSRLTQMLEHPPKTTKRDMMSVMVGNKQDGIIRADLKKVTMIPRELTPFIML